MQESHPDEQSDEQSAFAIPRIELWDLSLVYRLFEPFRSVTVVLDRRGDVEYMNRYTLSLLGARTPAQVIGKHWFNEFVPPAQRGDVSEKFIEILTQEGGLSTYVNPIVTLSGEERLITWNNAIRLDAEGNPCGTFSLGFDITEQRRAESLVVEQARRIVEMSTPILQIWQGVLLAPLVGSLEGSRADQLSSRLLESIAATRAKVALFDVTGLPQVDAAAAARLVATIAAARLVGASAIVTGIRPALALTMVEHGIDLSRIKTCATLMAGLKLALTLVDPQ